MFRTSHDQESTSRGLERYWEAINQLRNGDILDEMVARFFYREGLTHKDYNMFGRQFTMTAEPENIQAILATKFADFELGKFRRDTLEPLIGHGIFTADGPAWERARAAMRPQFSRAQVGDIPMMERHVQHIFDVLPVDASGWTSTVDLAKLFYRFTLDSATEFLFGQSVNSQTANLADGDRDREGGKSSDDRGYRSNEKGSVVAKDGLQEALAYSLEHLEDSGRIDRGFGLLTRQRFRAACESIYRFGDDLVQRALQTQTESDQLAANETSGHTERYILAKELAREIQDPIELRNQLLHVLMAGRDTTAALLAWVFLVLEHYPEVFSRLRQEILSTFGTGDSIEEITFADLKAVRYLQYVINETLRLYPVVPMNSRVATKDTTLPCGGGPDRKQPIAVMKGDLVGYSMYHMQRRTDLWGPDALEFKPERWEGQKSGWFYLPFSGGPRICLGRQSAHQTYLSTH